MKKLYLLVLLTIPAVLYVYFVPIIKPFPVLTGSYRIGLQTVEWKDLIPLPMPRLQQAGQHSIVAHIWYPANETKKNNVMPYLGKKLPYLQSAFAQLYSIPLWLSKLFFKSVNSRSYEHVSVNAEAQKWPVILFVHGLLGSPSDMYSAILEDLASHGYVVVGLDLPYFNFLTLHEDGTVSSSASLSAQFNAMSQVDQKEFMTSAIEVYKRDLSFAINQLQLINEDPASIFFNRLDLDRIGIMGHSAGGTAAIEFCRVDERCKAAVNLDGWYDHIISPNPLRVPLLMMFGEKSIEITEPSVDYLQRKELTKEQYYEREYAIVAHKEQLCKGDNCKMIIITGAEHAAFSDEILLKWPLRAWRLGDSYSIISKTNNEIFNFFDMYLK